MMNKIFIIGRLTADPEHRTTPNGVSVATFTVAVIRRMNRDKTDFIPVVTWRGLADNCAKYLTKGQQVAVSGELQMRTYDTKQGLKRTVFEIQADDVEFLTRTIKDRESQKEPALGLYDDELDDDALELGMDEDLPF